jgi:AraC-like DNA-binding protein
MNRKNFDVRSFIAKQPVDMELFRYKEALYPVEIPGITGKYGNIYTYVLDWHQGTYAYLSEGLKKLTGYDGHEKELGIETLFEVIHPDDAQPLQQMISKWMEVLLGKPEDEFNRFTANFNFRIRRSNGAYMNLLQQPVHVRFDKKGSLVYEAGILTDISRYKNDGNISLLILDPDHTPLLEYYPKEDFMPKIGELRQIVLDLERQALSSGNSWFRNVQKIIADNLSNESLDVDMICSELKISRSKFYRQLNNVSGMKPGRLIKTYRLLESLPLLSSREYSVSEIAWKTGFQSHSYFTCSFREQFGCTPSQYRAQVA